ncbi:monooxygenase, partial [Streptomyces rubellomurinus subsp. indigoferus]
MQPGMLATCPSRGLAHGVLLGCSPVPSCPFGATNTRLDFATLVAAHPFILALDHSVTEQLLEQHAVAVGAEVLRGQEVVSLTQGPDDVAAVVRDG